jgi:undecaprenyl diphosphate synthase
MIAPTTGIAGLPDHGTASGPGVHVAIIMDGNGRWAQARNRPRTAGHRAGADAVRRTVEAAPGRGITTLTLFAFSSDNWQRPRPEVSALMRLFEIYLDRETQRCVDEGVRVTLIGRRDRLRPALRRAVERAEVATAGGRRLHLRVAIDYSARVAILAAAAALGGGAPASRETFARLLAGHQGSAAPAPDVDLLIRTGGEKRLSDFLLWECAYAELVFLDRRWPDFGAPDLEEALRELENRERRFGRVTA